MRFDEFVDTTPVFARWLVRRESRIQALLDVKNIEPAKRRELETLLNVAKNYPPECQKEATVIARLHDLVREAEVDKLDGIILQKLREKASEASAALAAAEDNWLAGL